MPCGTSAQDSTRAGEILTLALSHRDHHPRQTYSNDFFLVRLHRDEKVPAAFFCFLPTLCVFHTPPPSRLRSWPFLSCHGRPGLDSNYVSLPSSSAGANRTCTHTIGGRETQRTPRKPMKGAHIKVKPITNPLPEYGAQVERLISEHQTALVKFTKVLHIGIIVTAPKDLSLEEPMHPIPSRSMFHAGIPLKSKTVSIKSFSAQLGQPGQAKRQLYATFRATILVRSFKCKKRGGGRTRSASQ